MSQSECFESFVKYLSLRLPYILKCQLTAFMLDLPSLKKGCNWKIGRIFPNRNDLPDNLKVHVSKCSLKFKSS